MITNLKSLCQNIAMSLNGMHLNIPSIECWTLCRAASSSGTAWVGNAYARSLAPWAILSISGYDDRTSPRLTFKAWSMIVVPNSSLWYMYLNFIAISSCVCPKLTCIELLVSFHNDRHLFAVGFVTVGVNRHEILVRLRKYIKCEAWKILLESAKFQHENNADVQTWLENTYTYRI